MRMSKRQDERFPPRTNDLSHHTAVFAPNLDKNGRGRRIANGIHDTFSHHVTDAYPINKLIVKEFVIKEVDFSTQFTRMPNKHLEILTASIGRASQLLLKVFVVEQIVYPIKRPIEALLNGIELPAKLVLKL